MKLTYTRIYKNGGNTVFNVHRRKSYKWFCSFTSWFKFCQYGFEFAQEHAHIIDTLDNQNCLVHGF